MGRNRGLSELGRAVDGATPLGCGANRKCDSEQQYSKDANRRGPAASNTSVTSGVGGIASFDRPDIVTNRPGHVYGVRPGLQIWCTVFRQVWPRIDPVSTWVGPTS